MKETKSNYCEHCGEFHDTVQDYTSQVKVGETVPDFEFEAYQHGAISTRSLSSLRGKWVVLVFYPADFTFVCPTELEEFAHLYPKFHECNAEVISVSTDSAYVHKAWHETSPQIGNVQYPMAADPSGKLAYAFGVLIEGGEPELTSDEGFAQRGTFIVDPAGTLRAMEVSDSSVGRSAAETLRKLEACQFVDTHKGQVCPASWQPGRGTIEVDKELKKHAGQ